MKTAEWQASCRIGFSTVGSKNVLIQLIERSNEYHIPPSILYVEYQKAFDSVETTVVLAIEKRLEIPEDYVSLLENSKREMKQTTS